ncbi:hypothetical protein L345_15062, partial [Ophiophagus hannah]
MKHLVRMASFSSQTNMHARNLAIVWAPNLLRSKDIEVSGFNGTAAFMEVRIQSIVVEFILNHVEQIFGNAPLGDDKLSKMRLRPAKSMDSLSCMPSIGDDDAHLGSEIPPKHECFDGPVSLDSSFSESMYMSAKSKCEDMQEEATKSEPTTPKTSRSGLIGGTSQGRSPKSSRNRAEKCAGVHISGPFSVTVPFHITSNLTLSRLTRGTNFEAEMENRMSMEVEDSFSFLDSPDGWIDNVMEEEQLQTDPRESPELEMYSTVPHLDYLSIEECMNEHLEGEDDQYYLAMGFIEEEPSKEVDAEEVYLSAFDDLSPIASKLEHLQQSDAGQPLRIPSPKLTVEDQTSKVATETLDEDPENSHLPEPSLEPQQEDEEVTTWSTCDLVVTKDLDPKLAKPPEVELGPRSNPNGMESPLTDKAEVEPIFSMLQIKDANVGSEVGLLVPKTGCPEEVAYQNSLDSEDGGRNAEDGQVEPIISLLQIEDRNGVDLFVPKTGCLEKVAGQTPRDPESENQPIKTSVEEKWQSWSAPESEQTPHIPCSMRVELLPEVVGRSNKPLGDTLVIQETGEMPHGDVARAASSVEQLNLLQSLIPSLLDNNSENVSFPAPNPEQTSSSSSSSFPASLSDSCMDSEDFSLTASSPKPFLENLLQKSQPGLPVEASYAPKHDFLDGSVEMKLTSTTPRVQQVKSFPVVPPKPQFAKVPPALKPVIPSKEHLAAVPLKTCENGTKQEFNQSSLKRPFHLTSFDHTTNSNQKAEHSPAPPSPSSSSENCCGHSEVLPKQRNSLPVSLEMFSKDHKNMEDITPKLPPSSRDKCFSWSKSGEAGGGSLHLTKGSLEKQNSGQHSEGKGHLYGAERSTKEALESGTPQKQRWSNWRYSGSMSFDEAVALAKERHVAQAPMQRMQTYSHGDVDGSHGASKMEKTSTPHKPVLRSPQRPLSCMSPAGPPEAHCLGKMPCSLGLPDNIPKGVPTPRLEGSNSYSQDFPPRSRVSLSKIGRRLSVSDEACFGLSHERR